MQRIAWRKTRRRAEGRRGEELKEDAEKSWRETQRRAEGRRREKQKKEVDEPKEDAE